MAVEELIKNFRTSKLILNISVVSLFLLLASLIVYSQSNDFYKGYFLVSSELLFMIFSITFLLGIFLTIKVNYLIDNDIVYKLEKKNIKITKSGYNLFLIEDSFQEKKEFKIDYNICPSYQIEIDFEKKEIFYK